MPVEVKETLEDIRNRLITDCKREPEAERAGYINGLLDMYNAARKLQKEEAAA
jgi:hypothetical protein